MKLVKPKKFRATLPERPESGTGHCRYSRYIPRTADSGSWAGNGCAHSVPCQKERLVKVVEVDYESVAYLREAYPSLEDNIIEDDFLKMNLQRLFDGHPFALTGNYPYNISSQIFFKMLDNKDLIPCCTGMIQKEVAERIAAGPGSKTYGILSVLIQAWYRVEYLFTVSEHVFNPPPK